MYHFKSKKKTRMMTTYNKKGNILYKLNKKLKSFALTLRKNVYIYVYYNTVFSVDKISLNCA